MEELRKFSPEVCAELKHYVYRLIDPRNWMTFYVGKRKNNRVFVLAECALKNNGDVDYNQEQDDEENLKYKIIREIKDSGLNVIYIVQKYGLNERDAFIVESTLIDVYSIERKMTNKIKGFNFSEPINAITLQRDLSADEYKDDKKIQNIWLLR